MRTHFSKLAPTAALALALTLTLSCSSDDGDEEVISTIISTSVIYDANGGVSSTSTTKTEYKYNGKDNVTLYQNGNMVQRSECKHYSKGNCTKFVFYDANGNMAAESENNSMGNITKQVSYDADGNMIDKIESEYEYDSYGNITKIVNYNAEGSITSSTRADYNCNSDGSFCTYSYYNDKGEVSYTGEAKYTTINSKRLMASQIVTFPSGKSIKGECEYDSRGNATKTTQYSRQSDTDSYRKTYETTTTYTYIRV